MQKLETRCKTCNKVLTENWYCSDCDILNLIPQDINYFQLFDVIEGFEIDKLKLNNSYFRLQILFHPDKFSGKNKDILQVSLNNSALINTAYGILLEDLSRAKYLIDINLGHYDEVASLPANFMMQTIKWHEDLMENKDSPEFKNALHEVEQAKGAFYNELSRALKHNRWQNANSILKQIYVINKILA